MKNIAMSSLVAVLALVGFGATTLTSSAKTASASATRNGVQVQASVVTTPAPVCAPGTTCGID